MGIGFANGVTYRYPVPGVSAAARSIAGVLVGFALAAGCRQLNASHCGNQDGNATCAQRNAMAPYCDRCEPANDGCVVGPVIEPGCGEAETSSNPETTTVETAGSTEASSSDGTIDTADGSSSGEPSLCGNGVIDGEEGCDGEVPPGIDCTSEGFGEGVPVCRDDCTLDFTDCEQYMLCGNGEVGFGEDCDGANLGGQTCDDFPNLTGAGLACDTDCTFDMGACLACRENEQSCDPGEVCCDPKSSCVGLTTKRCCLNGLCL